jgi:Fe-S cluster assembly scaffold protein SufB
MLIIGIFVIILSCFVVDRGGNKSSTESEAADRENQITQKELDSFKSKQSEILSSVSEDTIARTDEYLSRLSNEKIMAVTEYSDQILEKITKNHEEVVFLYNMLNYKEKELKETLKSIESSHKKAKELINGKASEQESDPVINKTKENTKKETIIKANIPSEPLISINNAEILKLYKKGNTVLDIARQLGIGQGEVKLVIDLFKDR